LTGELLAKGYSTQHPGNKTNDKENNKSTRMI
jgi:hypothetical protein